VYTAIAVFTSRERAEETLKELLGAAVPRDSIVFLSRSQHEAMAVAKEVGEIAGGMTGGVVGMGAGLMVASLALLPGIGQVFAVGVGATALLGLLGRKAGAAVAHHLAKEVEQPAQTEDEKGSEDAQTFVEVLKAGRSLLVVSTESAETAKTASGILDRYSLSALGVQTEPVKVGGKTQASVCAGAGGVTSIEMKGRIGIGEGNTMLRETIQQLVIDGHRKIVLVMREVDHIDSSGIGEIVRAHTLARKSNGQMKIAAPSPKVHEMLHITMLNKLIEIYPSETAAAESFTASAATA
jgi:anti-sigma B factor antagonist